MAKTPTFASTAPYVGGALVSATANTAYFSPGSTGQTTLYTAGSHGAQITAIETITGTTPSNCVVNIWRKLHSATTWNLIRSLGITSTATKKGAVRIYTFPNLKLLLTETLTCTCTVASQHIQVNVYGGSF